MNFLQVKELGVSLASMSPFYLATGLDYLRPTILKISTLAKLLKNEVK